jgi:hypothetical protein
MKNTKTVFTCGEWSIVRVESYGFRCNSLSVSWHIYRNDKFVSSALQLKKAKQLIALIS